MKAGKEERLLVCSTWASYMAGAVVQWHAWHTENPRFSLQHLQLEKDWAISDVKDLCLLAYSASLNKDSIQLGGPRI